MGKELGSRISDILQKRGMTQKELAGRIGVTEAVVSRYISGNRDPKPDMLANIATALHTTSDFLLGIEPEEFDHPRIRRLIARNASSMTEQEKKALIDALFGEE
jgi:transcriptional regulator with XRE-family HTH domain